MNRVERLYYLVDRMRSNSNSMRIASEKSPDFDISLFKKSPMFIISKHAPPEWASEFEKNLNSYFDLPFNNIVVATKTRSKDGSLNDAYFLIEEKIEDGEKVFFIDQIVDRGNEVSLHLREESTIMETTQNIMHFFSNYSYAKSKGELGVIKDVSVIDTDNSKKIKKKINNLYYIGKTNNPINIKGKSPRDIVWTKSWSCCGHWRKLRDGTETIGKDRQGNRVVVGMTWVKECTKGSGETVNSIRVIK